MTDSIQQGSIKVDESTYRYVIFSGDANSRKKSKLFFDFISRTDVKNGAPLIIDFTNLNYSKGNLLATEVYNFMVSSVESLIVVSEKNLNSFHVVKKLFPDRVFESLELITKDMPNITDA